MNIKGYKSEFLLNDVKMLTVCEPEQALRHDIKVMIKIAFAPSSFELVPPTVKQNCHSGTVARGSSF